MSVLAEHQIFKAGGGVFEVPKKFIRLSGADTVDFLHRITTQSVNRLSHGHGLPTALLQANGMILSFFDLYHAGHFFLIVVDSGLFQATWDALDRLHFGEDMVMKDVSSDFAFLSAQGPDAIGKLKEVLTNTLGRLPQEDHEIIGTEESFVARESDFDGAFGFHLLVKRSGLNEIKSQLIKSGVVNLSFELWELLRAESGHFQFGIDVNEKNLILEVALSPYVARNKGCYPGQEVVERVFTYGNVAKKLVGLELNGATDPMIVPAKLFSGDVEVGTLTSAKTLPWNGRCVGFGVVRKPHYEAGQNLLVAASHATARVVNLPGAFEIKRELA